MGIGILVPLHKPNKNKGPVKYIRPITLLEIMIEVDRTEIALDKYLSKSQSAYRKYRSTTDINCAFRGI